MAIPARVNFEGTRSDGSRVTFQFVPHGVIDGDGPAIDFQNVQFPSGWSDIVSLQVLDGKVALDNITVRGFGPGGFHASVQQKAPLEVLGVLESSPTDNTWGVMSLQHGKLTLRRQRYSNDPEYIFRFDLIGRTLGYAGSYSSIGSQNPENFEQAYVSNGALIWQSGAQPVELARIGQNGVIGIRYPKPAAGKVLFLNEGNENHGNPSVLLAGPGGINSHPPLRAKRPYPEKRGSMELS